MLITKRYQANERIRAVLIALNDRSQWSVPQREIPDHLLYMIKRCARISLPPNEDEDVRRIWAAEWDMDHA